MFPRAGSFKMFNFFLRRCRASDKSLFFPGAAEQGDGRERGVRFVTLVYTGIRGAISRWKGTLSEKKLTKLRRSAGGGWNGV